MPAHRSVPLLPAPGSPALSRSDRAYRALLALYPARYRREYGSAMAQLFHDLCRDAYRVGGEMALARAWFRVLPDAGRSAAAEHWAELRGGVLRGICVFDGQQRLSWRAFGLATALILAGIIGKSLVLQATGSVAAGVAVIVLSGVLAASVLDRAMATHGRLLAAGLIVTLSMLLPLAWTPDTLAWLRKNPLTAYTVVWLPFAWRRPGRPQSGMWLSVFVLSAINVMTAQLVGP
jgi:hypothetical protein